MVIVIVIVKVTVMMMMMMIMIMIMSLSAYTQSLFIKTDKTNRYTMLIYHDSYTSYLPTILNYSHWTSILSMMKHDIILVQSQLHRFHGQFGCWSYKNSGQYPFQNLAGVINIDSRLYWCAECFIKLRMSQASGGAERSLLAFAASKIWIEGVLCFRIWKPQKWIDWTWCPLLRLITFDSFYVSQVSKFSFKENNLLMYHKLS